MKAVISLYRLMERVGVTPRQCRAIFGKLTPKHKAGVEKVSLRSIGLLPTLYRHWCRLHQDVARTWESNKKAPCWATRAAAASWIPPSFRLLGAKLQ